MVKDSDLLKEILEKQNFLVEKVNSLEFTLVQSLGSGGLGSGGTGSMGGPAPSVTAEVDLGPLEQKLIEMSETMVTLNDLAPLQDELGKLTSGKVAQAEELIARSSLLIEKGLALTELEAALLEIKDRLTEVVIELSAIRPFMDETEKMGTAAEGDQAD